MAGEEQRIRQLERELQDTRSRMQATQSQIQEAMERENRRLTAEIQAAMQQESEGYRREFHRAVRAMQQGQDATIQKFRQELESLQKNQEAAVQELTELYRRIEQDIRREKCREAARIAWERQNAIAACARLRDACELCAEMPVEQFYPGKLRLYREALSGAQALFREGAYIPAAANAESGTLGAGRLRCDTKMRTEEFHAVVRAYRTLYEAVCREAFSPAARTEAVQARVTTLSVPQLDYWADGQIMPVVQELSSHGALLCAIGTTPQSEAAWLRRCGRTDAAGYIRTQIQELEFLPDITRVYIRGAFAAYRCYAEMLRVRDTVSQVAGGQNFRYMGMAFGALQDDPALLRSYSAAEESAAQEQCLSGCGRPDYREERRLRYSNPVSGGGIAVRFLPVREGTDVRNRILLRIESPYPDPFLEKTILSLLLGAGVPAESDCDCCPRELFSRETAERVLAAEKNRYAEHFLASGWA